MPEGVQLEQAFQEMKDAGIDSHRFDMRWETSLAGNLSDMLTLTGMQINADKFINDNVEILRKSLDVVSIDYYPGLWHLPAVSRGESVLKDMPKHTERLKKVLQTASQLGKRDRNWRSWFPNIF